MGEEKTLFEKLYEASEESFSRVAKEALSHPVVSEAMKKTLRNAAATKGKIDRSIETFLTLLNLPSKDDYNKLLAKVEAVQGSLVNLNIKLDRILAVREKPKRPSRRKPKESQSPSSAN
jgi:hypothetical protein